MPFHPVWFTDHVVPLCHVLILAVVVAVAWRNRFRRPAAARLFLVAASLSLVHLILNFLESSYLVIVTPRWIKSLGNSSQPDFSDSATITFLIWQGTKCSLRIACWSLVAWAILMRPDERRAKTMSAGGSEAVS